MPKKRPCQAKNPAVCRVHGSPGGSHPAFPDQNLIRVGMNNPIKDDVLKAFEKQSKLFKETLTKDEDYSLGKYMSLSYEYINPILRGTIDDEKNNQFFENNFNRQNSIERAKEMIPHIDSALAKYKTKKQHLTYRAFTVKKGENVDEYIANNFKIGKVLEDKAYFSTTADSDYLLLHNEFSQDRMFVFEILGKNGVPVSSVNSSEHSDSPSNYEREVLYPRNSKFKVVGITKNTYASSYDKYKINMMKSFFYNFTVKKETYSVIQLMEI